MHIRVFLLCVGHLCGVPSHLISQTCTTPNRFEIFSKLTVHDSARAAPVQNNTFIIEHTRRRASSACGSSRRWYSTEPARSRAETIDRYRSSSGLRIARRPVRRARAWRARPLQPQMRISPLGCARQRRPTSLHSAGGEDAALPGWFDGERARHRP
ncbi:hypothetical protein MRX96_053117 [Rhipicephalus microplus]